MSLTVELVKLFEQAFPDKEVPENPTDVYLAIQPYYFRSTDPAHDEIRDFLRIVNPFKLKRYESYAKRERTDVTDSESVSSWKG